MQNVFHRVSLTCSSTGLLALDLRQLGGTDQRVGVLQISPSGTLVVIRAVMQLSIAVGGTEVVSTPALVARGQASLLATEEAVLCALLLAARGSLDRR